VKRIRHQSERMNGITFAMSVWVPKRRCPDLHTDYKLDQEEGGIDAQQDTNPLTL